MIPYPLSAQDKQILKDAMRSIIPDIIIDVVWDRYFYWAMAFDSVTEGWATSIAGSGTGGAVSFTGGIATLTSHNVSGDVTSVEKNSNNDLIDWSKHSRFRFDFNPSGSVSNVIRRMLVGRELNGVNYYSHYGFSVSGSTISGICGDKTNNAQSSVVLKTGITSSDLIRCEARFYPNSRIVFYVDGVEKGSLSTNLPKTDNDTGYNPELFYFGVETAAAANKSMILSFMEFIQQK